MLLDFSGACGGGADDDGTSGRPYARISANGSGDACDDGEIFASHGGDRVAICDESHACSGRANSVRFELLPLVKPVHAHVELQRTSGPPRWQPLTTTS